MIKVQRVAVVFVLLALAAALAWWVRSGVPAVDRSMLNFALAHRNPARTQVFRAVTACGGTVPATALAVLVAVIAALRRWWTLALQAVIAGVGAAVLVVVLKTVIGRPRPPAATQLGVLQSLSFPSGHALGSVTAALLVLALLFATTGSRTWRALGVLVAAVYVVAVGLSRLYLGVHWATDVVGGWLIGSGWAMVCLSLRPRSTS